MNESVQSYLVYFMLSCTYTLCIISHILCNMHNICALSSNFRIKVHYICAQSPNCRVKVHNISAWSPNWHVKVHNICKWSSNCRVKVHYICALSTNCRVKLHNMRIFTKLSCKGRMRTGIGILAGLLERRGKVDYKDAPSRKSCGTNQPSIYVYRVFIKYCVFSFIFCDFSELCQFCYSTGSLPAWCVYTH